MRWGLSLLTKMGMSSMIVCCGPMRCVAQPVPEQRNKILTDISILVQGEGHICSDGSVKGV